MSQMNTPDCKCQKPKKGIAVNCLLTRWKCGTGEEFVEKVAFQKLSHVQKQIRFIIN